MSIIPRSNKTFGNQIMSRKSVSCKKVVGKTLAVALYGLAVPVIATEGPTLAETKAENVPAVNHEEKTNEEAMIVTAQEMLKQQPGVSVITSEDLSKQPPVNDLSDIIRKMPGVNLTGNSSSGQRGNNRQIDIRGMGPENTLILIDGVPVTSRNAVRYTWNGERDTRGDSNWVPAEQVERIEVIRGPAAARYGSGASGGVVNIITKRPTNAWHGSLSYFLNQPESSLEGNTNRTNFSLSGPLAGDRLTMRLYGNWNKTKADSPDLNGYDPATGLTPAGHEGVRNKDANVVFSWKPTLSQIIDFEAGYSRQGNIYAGDTQFSTATDKSAALASSGAETNRIYRQNYGITHNGIWDWGQSKLSFQYDETRNSRLEEGLAGRGEGTIGDDAGFKDSILKDYRVAGEINVPLDILFEQTVTLGAEWTRSQLNDPASTGLETESGDVIPGLTDGRRSTESSSELSGIYLEDNIQLTDTTQFIPGMRFDYQKEFGANYSPSLNISQELGEMFKLKAGIARAFKAPNLYQMNPNYLLYSRGYGCPLSVGGQPCYLKGNDELEPEISINKELGLEFSHNGWMAGLTYFRNDYKNKIVSGTDVLGITSGGNTVLQWENTGKAVIQGLEGSVTVPVTADLKFTTNATYMIESKDKTTGNPLSIIPKYTVNSMLDWSISPQLTANLNYTYYGPQKPRTQATSELDLVQGINQTRVGSYGLVGLGIKYEMTKYLDVKAGVTNLFDKDIKRTAEGASSYNEPGRAYYSGVSVRF